MITAERLAWAFGVAVALLSALVLWSGARRRADARGPVEAPWPGDDDDDDRPIR